MTSNQQKLHILNNLSQAYDRHSRPSFTRFSSAIRTILGQQTSRPSVQRVMTDLEPYLSVATLAELSETEIDTIISHIRFHQHKAGYIKAYATWYLNHNGDQNDFSDMTTAELRKELLALPGIGNETADTIMLYSFERKIFIADQYAMQLFNRLGFGPYQKYQLMQADFQPLTDDVSFETVRNWHYAIDQHSHDYNLHQEDESWLLK